MFQDKVQDSFLGSQENGLGKFSFGGFAKWVVKKVGGVIRDKVPLGIGNLIADALNELMNDGWELKSGEIYEPTLTEQNLVDGWVDTKFSPFCGNLTKELDTALKSPDLKSQVEKINKVLSKICFVQTYYRTNNTNGLSADAVQWRSDYIKSIFTPFLNLIETTLSAKPVISKQMKNVNSNLNYLEVSTIASITSIPSNYTCNHYAVNQNVILEPAIPAITSPVDGTVTEVPTAPTKTDGTTATDSNFLQKNAVWFGIAGMAIWAFSGKKKSKK